MKITEAMAEVKLANRKIQTSFEFVMRNLRREDWRKDPFEKDGTTQEAQVKAALQSIQDNELRVVALKHAINKVNMALQLEVGGMSMSVAEWLLWRRDILPVKKNNLTMLVNAVANIGREQPQARRTFAGQVQTNETIPNWVVNISDKWLLEQIQSLDAIEQQLDGQLSMLNANTEIEV